MNKKDKTCKERIQDSWEFTKNQLKEVISGKESIWNLALAWDKDFHESFTDLSPCDSLCLSYGGPADYIRFYHNGQISYVFQDWFDGAEIFLSGEDFKLAKEIKDLLYEY